MPERSPHTDRARRVLVALATSIAIAVPTASSIADAAPAVTTGGPFTYVEQAPPTNIGAGTSVTGSNYYDGQYVDIEIAGATGTEHLALERSTTADTTDGVVSIVGSAVYIGDGTTAIPIGSIDATFDGRSGSKLRVRFGSDFRNAGFETGDIAPWTTIEDFVELGVTSIAGFVTQDTVAYPGNSGGDGDRPTSASYTVAVTSANPPGPTEGSYALGLTSNMTTRYGCDVVHGPAAYSGAFDAVAGQTLTFDWRAYAGSDAYSVFGYLLNTTTGAQTEVLDQTTTNASGTTNWATVSVTVPADGTYRFVFVSGTYDATCGRAAGASLYVDNFQVVSADYVDDAMVSKVLSMLTYENTSDDPSPVRTVSVTARNTVGQTASGNITVNVTPVNDPPVGTPLSAVVENTPLDDLFVDATGTLGFTDVDDTTLSYGITGGVPGAYTVGADTYDVRAVGAYGTLYVNATTGAYRVVPDDAAIEAVAVPAADIFTVEAFDGDDTGTTTFRFGVTLPPVPRAVQGVAGNGQATVSWLPPTEVTGVTGYVVTAAPGGATCTVTGAASTSCVVTGLANGTPYTFTVAATYTAAVGNDSLPSSPVTPVGPPTAPLNVRGTPGEGRLLVEWDPPANDGGAPVTQYTVSASPGGLSCTTTGSTDCTVIGLALGTTYTFTVTATNSYGDGPPSAPMQYTVRSATSTSLTLSANPTMAGDEVTLTATVSGSSPTGSVEFFDGASSLGSVALAGGSAQLATSALAPGVHAITAVYSGDADDRGSTSPAAQLTVRTATSVALATSVSNPVLGDEVTLTATVSGSSPTGSVEFFDGATSLGTVPVTGGVAELATTALATGAHSITAVYGGDQVNLGSTSDAVDVAVKAVATVAVAASDLDPVVGEAVTLTATVSGSSPTGSVELFDGATSLGVVVLSGGVAQLTGVTFSEGAHSITAVYPGDAANSSASSAPLVLGVDKTVSTVTVGFSAQRPRVGDAVTITATVAGRNPSGTVEFRAGGTTLGTATLVDGVARLSTSTLPAGRHGIVAVYRGDAANTGATSTAKTLEVVKTTAAVTVTTPATEVLVGEDVELDISVAGRSPTGTVTVLDGTVAVATVPLVGGSVDVMLDDLAAGVHRLSVVYSGDAANSVATSAVLRLEVNRHDTTIVLRVDGREALGGAVTVMLGDDVTLVAVVNGSSPTGTVEFFTDGARLVEGFRIVEDVGTSLGTAPVIDGVSTLEGVGLALGEHDVTARYSGDDANSSVTSSISLVEVITRPTVAPRQSVVASDGTVVVEGDGYEPFSVVTVRLDGPDGPVVATVTVDANGSFATTVQLADAAAGTHALHVDGIDGAGSSATQSVAVEVSGVLPATGGGGAPMMNLALALSALGVVLVASARRSARRRTLA